MKPTLFSFAAAGLLGLVAVSPAWAQGDNLIPNGDFTASYPLKGWRIDFPYQEQYVKNAGYVKMSDKVNDGEARAIELTLPKGVAENEGGKVETAFVKIEAGASYRVSVDVMTYDIGAKIFVEVYALDPLPPGAPSMDRIPAMDGVPALVKCYRAGTDDPKPQTKHWVTVRRDFTVPASVVIAGKPAPPVYASIKAFGYSPVQGGFGKVYFSRFILTKNR